MKRLLDLIKDKYRDEDMYCHLIGNMETRTAKKMLKRYYSIACHLMNLLDPSMRTVIITDFRLVRPDRYAFLGMWSNEKGDRIFRLDSILESLNFDIDYLIPDCYLEGMRDTFILAEILRQIDLECKKSGERIPTVQDQDFFERVEWRRNVYASDMYFTMEYVDTYLSEIIPLLKIMHLPGELKQYQEEAFPHYSIQGLLSSFLSCNTGEKAHLFREYTAMDSCNPPAEERCHRSLEKWCMATNSNSLEVFADVKNKGERLVLEANPLCPSRPLVYVIDRKGNKQSYLEQTIERLLCMNICVMDKSYTPPLRLLALLLFYRDYPLRVSREQKDYFKRAFTGMLYQVIK